MSQPPSSSYHIDRSWNSDPHWRDLYPQWAEPIFKDGIDVKSKITNDTKRFAVEIDAYQFRPEEIRVKTIDDTLLIEGRHEDIRDSDNFTKMYFVRKYQLPADVRSEEISSTIDRKGRLVVETIKRPQQVHESNQRFTSFCSDRPASQTGLSQGIPESSNSSRTQQYVAPHNRDRQSQGTHEHGALPENYLPFSRLSEKLSSGYRDSNYSKTTKRQYQLSERKEYRNESLNRYADSKRDMFHDYNRGDRGTTNTTKATRRAEYAKPNGSISSVQIRRVNPKTNRINII